MLVTETIATPGPLLGAAPMPLALRIRGTERGGQVVRLKSPKIAIGSSPKCALRLKSPGVAPLHCLILRGAEQTIVRRWHRDTRLNGGTFEDSPLYAGDRLAIGPIEFDVVEERAHGERRRRRDTEATTSPAAIEAALAPLTERLQLANTQSRRRARGLLTKLRAATRKAEQLERRVAEGREQSREMEHRWSQWEHDRRALDDERQRWQEVHTQTEHLLARRREQLDEQARRLAADRKSLAADLAALDADRQALDERYHALDAARAELENKRAAWQQQRGAEEAARTAKLAELATREDELNRRAAELAEPLPGVSDTGTRLGETRLQDTRQQAEAAPLPNFAALLAELAAEREALAAAREHWIADQAAQTAEQNHRAAELAKLEHELAARQEMLDRQQAELESQRQALAATRDQLEELRAQLAAQQQADTSHTHDADAALVTRETELSQRAANLTQLEAELNQRASELRVQQDNLEQTTAAREAEWHQECAELEVRVGAVEQHQAELTARQRQLEADRQELEKQRAELTAQRQQLEADRTSLAAERQQWQDEISNRPVQSVLANEVETEENQANTNSPLSSTNEEAEQTAPEAAGEEVSEKHDDDVFARLRAMSILKSDEATSAGESATGEAEHDSREEPQVEMATAQEPVAVVEPAEPPRRVVQPTAAPTHAEGEDESIDDYMAKLLQRMRGVATEKPIAVSKPTNTAPEQAPPQPMAAEAAVETRDADEPAPAPKPVKLEPRKVAPEKSVDLAAMRELANTSARAAIATHQKQRGWSKAWGKVGVGMVGLACGAGALWKAPSQESPIFFGGIAGLVIATFWLGQAVFMAGHAKFAHREEAKPVEKTNAEKESAAGR